MAARIEPETTRPILRSTLRELVRETRAREARPTTRIPRMTLVTLLQEERELSTPIELGTPTPAAFEITERVWKGSGTFATDARRQLVLAFVTAVIAGLLLTAPFWW